MQAAIQSPEDGFLQIVRVRQFMAWLLPSAFVWALLHGMSFVLFHDLALGLGGVIIFAYGCVLLVAHRQLQRGRLTTAVVLICAGLLGMIPAHVLALPDLYPALAVVPLLVVAIALPYLHGRTMRYLTIACWLVTIIVPLFGRSIRLLPPPPSLFTNVLGILSVPTAVGLVLLLLWQYYRRLRDTLALTQTTNEALRATQTELEAEMAQRTAALVRVQALAEEQARLLAENDQQRQAIRELSVPVLPINSTTLVMPLVGALDTARLHLLQDRALHALEQVRARYLVLDITGVPVMDTQVTQGLLAVTHAARLLGAEVVLVGVRPEVAQTMVGLGISFAGMRTFSDLHAALTSTHASTGRVTASP